MARDEHDHDLGLAHDLARLAVLELGRRRALLAILGTPLVPWLGCGGAETPSSSASSGACSEIPDETDGPYPADGTNGPNVLTSSGVVRSDITSSFGSMSGTATGVPLRIVLSVVSVGSGCAPLGACAVYLWHCDREGQYSIYTAQSVNYLRGVAVADDAGNVTFESIFPGCYPGRWPHLHFEVYPSLNAATSATRRIKTSQIALIEAACVDVYRTAGYEQSAAHLSGVTLQSDGVFADGATLELPTMNGSAREGYALRLTVPVMV